MPALSASSPSRPRPPAPRSPTRLARAALRASGLLLALGLLSTACADPFLVEDPGAAPPLPATTEADWVRVEREHLGSSWRAGRVDRWTFDDEGRLVEVVDTIACYCEFGWRPRRMQIERGEGYDLVTTDYDEDGDVDERARYDYDEEGRLLYVERAFEGAELWSTDLEWDDAGRLVRTTDQDGTVTEATRRPDGKITAVAEDGVVYLVQTWDERGRLASREDYDVYTFAYDDEDRMVAHTYSRPGEWSSSAHHTYDEEGRLVLSSSFEGSLREGPVGERSWVYDEDGRPELTSQVDFRSGYGNAWSHGFDEEGRLVEWKWSGTDSPGGRVTFHYERTEDGDLLVEQRDAEGEVQSRTRYRQLPGAVHLPTQPSLWPNLDLPSGAPLPPLAARVLEDL